MFPVGLNRPYESGFVVGRRAPWIGHVCDWVVMVVWVPSVNSVFNVDSNGGFGYWVHRMYSRFLVQADVFNHCVQSGGIEL